MCRRLPVLLDRRKRPDVVVHRSVQASSEPVAAGISQAREEHRSAKRPLEDMTTAVGCEKPFAKAKGAPGVLNQVR